MYLGSGIRLWIGLASLLACVGAGCRSSTIDARPSVAAPASDEEALRLLQENLGNHPLKGDLPWQQGRDYGAESEGFFVTAGAQGPIGPFTRTDIRFPDLSRVEATKRSPLIGADSYYVRVETRAGAVLYLACDDMADATRLLVALRRLAGMPTPPSEAASVPPVSPPALPASPPNPPDKTPLADKELEQKLSTLKGLYDKGLITKEEYDAKRKELLDRFR